MGNRYINILRWMLLAATMPTAAAFAQSVDTQASLDMALPPGFRGSISYRGSYQGQVIFPGPAANQGSWGGQLTQMLNARRQSIGGSFDITLEFNGDSVSGAINPAQPLQAVHVTGTRSGTTCYLQNAQGMRTTNYCGRDAFRQSFSTVTGFGNHLSYDAQASAAQLVDYVERDRQQAAAATAARQRQASAGAAEAARIAAMKPAPAALSKLLEAAVDKDSRSWSGANGNFFGNRFDAGSIHNVRISGGAPHAAQTLHGTYSFNGGTEGWVEAEISGGKISCLQYWDTPSCEAVRTASQNSRGAGPRRETLKTLVTTATNDMECVTIEDEGSEDEEYLRRPSLASTVVIKDVRSVGVYWLLNTCKRSIHIPEMTCPENGPLNGELILYRIDLDPKQGERMTSHELGPIEEAHNLLEYVRHNSCVPS